MSTSLKPALSKTFVQSPWFCGCLGLVFYSLQSLLIPATGWNIVEIAVGRNFLHGNGYVLSIGDPPALWRPFGGSLLCGLIGLFVRDDLVIYRLYYIFTLTSFALGSFCLGNYFWRGWGGAFSLCLLFATPAFVAFPLTANHVASHLSVLFGLAWAFLFLLQWMEGRKAKYAAAGALSAWIWVGLSRYELFVVGLVLFGFAGLVRKKTSPWKRWVPLIALFLVMFLKSLLVSHSAKQHGLIENSPIYHFYTGEAHSLGYGSDDDGWALSLKTYGTAESNENSLVKLILRYPGEVKERFVRNYRQAYQMLFRDSKVFFLPWIFLFVVSLPFFWKAREVRLRLFTFALALGAMSPILLFHIDPRYLLPSAGILYFLLAYSGILIMEKVYAQQNVESRILKWWLLALIFTGFFTIRYPLPKVGKEIGYQHRYLGEPFQQVGEFIRTLHLPNVPAVQVDVGPTPHIMDGFFAYYADTKAPHSVYAADTIPRDRLYSFHYQREELHLISDSELARFPQYPIARALKKFETKEIGSLYLFKAN